MLEPGDRAPAFELADLRGGNTSLTDLLAAGPALLAFFKISCPVCQLTFPYLDRIYRGMAERVFQIAGISQDGHRATEEFNREFGVTFPTLLDRDHYSASNAYGISHVPSLFLIERDGSIAWTLEGWSRKEIAALAGRAGVNPFRPGEKVPEWKSG